MDAKSVNEMLARILCQYPYEYQFKRTRAKRRTRAVERHATRNRGDALSIGEMSGKKGKRKDPLDEDDPLVFLHSHFHHQTPAPPFGFTCYERYSEAMRHFHV